MKAWYFAPANKKLQHGDGRDIALGVTHTVAGPPVLCERGLHGSVRILDALEYATDAIIFVVEIGGEIVQGDDKLCGTERTYLRGGIDITDILRAFARRCALDVAHLWAMPDIVRQYLETGDDGIRKAAGEAAWAAVAVRAAVRAAAGEAAGDKYNTWLTEMVEEAIAKEKDDERKH